MSYPPGYYPPATPVWQPQRPTRHGGMAITGMVFGIVTFALCWFPFVPVIVFGIMCGMALVGLVISVVARATAWRNFLRTGVATTGIVFNVLTLVMIGLFFLALATGATEIDFPAPAG